MLEVPTSETANSRPVRANVVMAMILLKEIRVINKPVSLGMISKKLYTMREHHMPIQVVEMQRTAGEYGFYSDDVASFLSMLISQGCCWGESLKIKGLNMYGFRLCLKLIINEFRENAAHMETIAHVLEFSLNDLLFSLSQAELFK